MTYYGVNVLHKISDYFILEKIFETQKTTIYRGQKDNTEETVIIKLLKAVSPTASEIARFKKNLN